MTAGRRGGATVASQLHAALVLTVDRKGHLPSCGHGLWLNGYTNQPGQRHECDLTGCDGEGQPCTKRCQAVRAALLLEIT